LRPSASCSNGSPRGKTSQTPSKDPPKEPPKETKTTGSAPPTDPAPAPEEASSVSFEGNRSETTGERTPEEEAFKKEEAPEHPVPVAAVLDDEQNRGQELSEMAKDFGANPRQKGDLSAYAKRFGFDHTIDLAGYAFRQGSQKGSSHKALFWKAVGEGLATGHPWDVPAPDPGPDPEIEARRQAEKAAQEAKEAEEEAAAAEQQRRALMLWTEASKEQRAELLRDEWLRKWAPKNDETPGR
jgi:hypothetical protein